MNINILRGIRRRESCFFYRRDTIGGVFRQPVCERSDFKKPQIGKCMNCSAYAPYLSISELAQRERERYEHFLKVPLQKLPACRQMLIPNTVHTNNPYVKRSRTNCNSLLAYMGDEDDSAEQTQQSTIPLPIQRRLADTRIRYI